MADLKLSTFAEKLKNVARPNRFLVTFSGVGSAGWQDDFSFYIKDFVIPNKNIGEIILNYGGLQNKIPGDLTIDDLAMTVHVDDAMKIRVYFEDWLERIVTLGEDGQNTRAIASDIRAIIDVQQLDGSGNVVKGWKCLDCWPKTLDSISLSHDSSDTGEEQTLSFATNMWYRV